MPQKSNNPNFSNNPYVKFENNSHPAILSAVGRLQKRAHSLATEVRAQRTMEKPSKMTLEGLQEWLLSKEMPMEVTESFEGGDIARVIVAMVNKLCISHCRE